MGGCQTQSSTLQAKQRAKSATVRVNIAAGFFRMGCSDSLAGMITWTVTLSNNDVDGLANDLTEERLCHVQA